MEVELELQAHMVEDHGLGGSRPEAEGLGFGSSEGVAALVGPLIGS